MELAVYPLETGAKKEFGLMADAYMPGERSSGSFGSSFARQRIPSVR